LTTFATRTRRLPALMSLLALTALSLALPMSGAHAQGKGETVKFHDYPGTGNMLIRVAISKGYCEKYGIKCELQVIPSGPLGAQALVAKTIEAGFLNADNIAPAILRGAKMKMVVGGASSNTANAIVGLHVDAPNAGKPFPAFMQDMKGKKIGVPARGSSMEGTARWMLTKAGISPDDVTFVAVGAPNTAYGALTTKQVDYLFMFEPAASMCEVLKTCKRVWSGALDKEPAEQYALNGGGAGLVFRQEYIDQNPHVIEAVIKAVKDADAFINTPANFKEINTICQKYFRFEFPKGDEVLETVLRFAVDAHTYIAPINRKAIMLAVQNAADMKIIDKVPPIGDLVDSRAPQ
jgi:NitT/TauT family transport system substrate-binding protein